MENLTMQIEGDQRLLQFQTYEDYLDSMVTCRDISYLRSILDCRMIAELGYRSSGDTLTREQFWKRLKTCRDFFFLSSALKKVISQNVDINNTVLYALASRESANRTGKLATIIFLRIKTKLGFEISAYIDYADRLSREDWLPIFTGRKKILPSMEDLSYFHWKNEIIRKNNTMNYKVVIDPELGLLFQCWHDRKVINVHPNLAQPWHSVRTMIPTQDYEQFVLYDHMVRRRC